MLSVADVWIGQLEFEPVTSAFDGVLVMEGKMTTVSEIDGDEVKEIVGVTEIVKVLLAVTDGEFDGEPEDEPLEDRVSVALPDTDTAGDALVVVVTEVLLVALDETTPEDEPEGEPEDELEDEPLGVTDDVVIVVTEALELLLGEPLEEGEREGDGAGGGGLKTASHVSVSPLSMLNSSAVPTTNRVMPSLPIIWLDNNVVHTPPGDKSEHSSAGATTRSLCSGLSGCAAGQSRRPREDGIARALSEVHESRSVD